MISGQVISDKRQGKAPNQAECRIMMSISGGNRTLYRGTPGNTLIVLTKQKGWYEVAADGDGKLPEL